MITVKQIQNPTSEEISDTCRILLEAFNYEYFLGALMNDKALEEPCMRAHISDALIGGEIHVAVDDVDGIVGAGLWYGPQQQFLLTAPQREDWDALMKRLNTRYEQWWSDFINGSYRTLCEDSYGSGVKLRSYHLQVFGVTPKHQRKGIGRAILEFAENKAHSVGVNTLLETMGKQNLTIYKSMGYEISGQATISFMKGSGVMYAMTKEL